MALLVGAVLALSVCLFARLVGLDRDRAFYPTVVIARARDGQSARLGAGFCWPWSEPEADGSLTPDVQIGDWRMPWNRKPPEMCKKRGTTPAPGLHPYTLWATRPEGVEEVGCIYSAQGFEFDYVGVIVGRDLEWDVQRQCWNPNLALNRDTSFKRGLTKNADIAVRQLAHVYRVLATRGMKGAYFYFCDAGARERFERLLSRASELRWQDKSEIRV